MLLQRRHQNLSGPPVHIHKPLAACRRTDQCFGGALYRKLKALAPGDGKVSINLQLIILKFYFNKLFPRAVTFENRKTASDQAGIKKPSPPAIAEENDLRDTVLISVFPSQARNSPSSITIPFQSATSSMIRYL